MKSEEFEEYLKSIGGLENGYFMDRPPITVNICECGAGWLDLIKNCIEDLMAIGWNKEICQIKEKFGGLRFYTNGLPEGGFDIIRKYAQLSYQTCEACGNLGEVRDGHWVRTLCDSCHKKSK